MSPPLTIPLHYLHELFTGDSPPKLAGVSVQSRHPLVFEEVFLSRWELGALIAKLDPEETLFHVELFPTITEVTLGKSPSHAEVYTAQVWKDSAARSYKLRAPLSIDQKEQIIRRAALQSILTALQKRKAYAKAQQQLFAEMIANCHMTVGEDNNLVDLTELAVTLKLSNEINQLTDDLTNLTTPDGTIEQSAP